MKKTKKTNEKVEIFDVIVVGSGPAGISAAYPLVKAGLRVAIIDGGLDSKKKDSSPSNLSEVNITETSNAYDLIRKSSYVFNQTYRFLKVKSDIEIIQSLAKGGLSEVWHGICDFFSAEELSTIGLPPSEIQKEYKEIANRINLNRRLFTQDKNEFVLYRVPVIFPYTTAAEIDELLKFNNFSYIPNQLIQRVVNTPENVEVYSFAINNGKKNKFTAKYVILAAGSINSTRIMLNSLNLYNHKVTFLTKPHYLSVCFNLKSLFSLYTSNKHDFDQLALSGKKFQKGVGNFFIQLYKFNPLASHKSLKYIPLPRSIAMPLLSFFIPCLIIADIRFPGFVSKNTFSFLKQVGKDNVLHISFKESKADIQHHQKQLTTIYGYLRSLGIFPLKTVSDYVTAHYAGGIPFQKTPGKLSVDEQGRLHQGNRIYIADSATWKVLPAKAPTMTIMANASWVGKNVLKSFKKN